MGPLGEEPDRRALVDAARLSSLGLYMGLCIGLCSYLGVLADRHWGTGTVGTLIGFLIGAAAAFYGLFREVRRPSPPT